MIGSATELSPTIRCAVRRAVAPSGLCRPAMRCAAVPCCVPPALPRLSDPPSRGRVRLQTLLRMIFEHKLSGDEPRLPDDVSLSPHDGDAGHDRCVSAAGGSAGAHPEGRGHGTEWRS